MCLSPRSNVSHRRLAWLLRPAPLFEDIPAQTCRSADRPRIPRCRAPFPDAICIFPASPFPSGCEFNALRIAVFDAGRELATIGGFSAPASGNPNLTDVLRLTGRITVKDGIAQTNNLEAQLLIGKLAAKGTADVATEVLNLKLSVVLSKAFSDKVGGTRVGGYMNTALSNSAGELVIPAMMTGSFKQPKFAPD